MAQRHLHPVMEELHYRWADLVTLPLVLIMMRIRVLLPLVSLDLFPYFSTLCLVSSLFPGAPIFTRRREARA